MIPEFTKPITIISVADELWISTVTASPMNTPRNLFEVMCSRIPLSLSPAAFCRPVDIIDMPNKNSPTPPSSEKNCVRVSARR